MFIFGVTRPETEKTEAPSLPRTDESLVVILCLWESPRYQREWGTFFIIKKLRKGFMKFMGNFITSLNDFQRQTSKKSKNGNPAATCWNECINQVYAL